MIPQQPMPPPQPPMLNVQLQKELEQLLGEKQQLNAIKQKYSNPYQRLPMMNNGMNGPNGEVNL